MSNLPSWVFLHQYSFNTSLNENVLNTHQQQNEFIVNWLVYEGCRPLLFQLISDTIDSVQPNLN
jgi:hypothetical protein